MKPQMFLFRSEWAEFARPAAVNGEREYPVVKLGTAQDFPINLQKPWLSDQRPHDAERQVSGFGTEVEQSWGGWGLEGVAGRSSAARPMSSRKQTHCRRVPSQNCLRQGLGRGARHPDFAQGPANALRPAASALLLLLICSKRLALDLSEKLTDSLGLSVPVSYFPDCCHRTVEFGEGDIPHPADTHSSGVIHFASPANCVRELRTRVYSHETGENHVFNCSARCRRLVLFCISDRDSEHRG